MTTTIGTPQATATALTATAPTTPFPNGSGVSLFDLSQATENYLRNEVTAELIRVTTDVGKDEEGVISLRFTNADEDRGIRLEDVTVHLTVDEPRVLKLSADVGTLLEARRTGDRGDDRLDSDDLVSEMFVFFPQASLGFDLNDVLEPGERLDLEVPYRGNARGTTSVTAHLHGSVSTADLFPRTNGSSPEISMTILR